MRVQILSSTQEIIASQAQLRELLLDRIPTTFQHNFLQPPEPEQLSISDFGVDKNEFLKAIELLEKAIAEQQKVVIFGDYDCDGVTATAVLWEALHARGISAQPFLPHREKHGYGLSQLALQEIFATEKPDLLITVDNGIVAQAEVEWLKQQGVKVIITDHHEAQANLPAAHAVVHTTQVAGVGAAWLLARALVPNQANDLLDLVVIGTIADQVPLLGSNRSLATHGLLALRQTKRPSLLTLADIAGADLSQATTNTINYSLAPRINAMGRLYHAMDALRALVTKNPFKTRELMGQLDTVNAERQAVTEEALSEVENSLLSTSSDSIVIAAGPYHEGVIGLIASKLVDQYHKPSIVLSTVGEIYKASCRSVVGVHLTNLLRSLPEEMFLSLGGHAMAAGFSIESNKLKEITEVLLKVAKQEISSDLLTPKIEVLGQLDWSLLNLETVNTIDTFAPYGPGNREPLFVLDDIEITDTKTVGRNQDHLKLQVRHKNNGLTTSAICFQFSKKLPEDLNLQRLAIRLKASTYRRGDVDIEVVAAE